MEFQGNGGHENTNYLKNGVTAGTDAMPTLITQCSTCVLFCMFIRENITALGPAAARGIHLLHSLDTEQINMRNSSQQQDEQLDRTELLLRSLAQAWHRLGLH